MKFDLPMLWSNIYQSAAEYSAEIAMKEAVMKRDGLGSGRVLGIEVCFHRASIVCSEDNERWRQQRWSRFGITSPLRDTIPRGHLRDP